MPPSNQNMDEISSQGDEIQSQVVDPDLTVNESVQSANQDQTQVAELVLETNEQSDRTSNNSEKEESIALTESLTSDGAESSTEALSPIDTSVVDSVTLPDIVDDVSVGVSEIIAERKAGDSSQETKEGSRVIITEDGDEPGPISTPKVQRMDNHASNKGTDASVGEESAYPVQNIEATKANKFEETTNETGQNEDGTINLGDRSSEQVVEIVNPGETSETEVLTKQTVIGSAQQSKQEVDSAPEINLAQTASPEQNTQNTNNTKLDDVEQINKQEFIDGPPKTPEEKQKAAKDWIEKHIVTTEDKDASTQPKYVHKLILDDHEEIPEEYSSEIVLLLLGPYKDSPDKEIEDLWVEEEFIKSNISKLHSLDDRAVGSIIENFHLEGMVSWLLDNIEYFPSIKPDRELTNRLVGGGWGSEVVDSIKSFGDIKLDTEIADMLINSHQADVVIEHIKEFDGVFPDEVFVDRLIDLGDVDLVIDNLEVFNGVVIDEEFINRSIKKNPENIVRILEAKSTPQALLNDEFAKLVIETEGSSWLFCTLEKFSPNLSNELANQIIQSKDDLIMAVFFENISKFPELDTPKLLEIIDTTGLKLADYAFFIDRLPEAMQSEVVLNRLQQEDIAPDDIKILIEHSIKLDNDVMKALEVQYGVEYVFQYRGKFEDFVLDMELANKLQTAGILCSSIDVFPPSMHEDLVRIICEKTPGDLKRVVYLLEDLTISDGLSEKVQKIYDLQKELNWSSGKDFDSKFDEYIKTLSQYFPDYDSNALIIRLENDFPGIFEKLVGKEDLFLQNFNKINEDAAKVIAEKGYSWLSAIAKNHERFFGNGQNPIVEKAQFVNGQIEQLDIYIRSEVFKYVDIDKDLEILQNDFPKIVNTLLRIQNSASSELVNFAYPIMNIVLASDNPQETLDNIEQIFVRNNLPTPIKLLEVYRILNPEVSDLITGHRAISPVLKHEVEEGRSPFDTFAADLIRASIGSNSRSLRQFLQTIKDGESLMSALDNPSFDLSQLSEEDQKQITIFLDRLDTIADVTNMSNGQSTGEMSLQERYWQLKHDLGADNETLVNRVTRLLAYPVGMSSVDQLLEEMDQIAYLADTRGRQLASSGEFILGKGDLVKGVVDSGTIGYLGTILQNGSVAKEFLGDSSGSDATPLDTDLSRILEQRGSIKEALLTTTASGYGELFFVLKDRDDRFLVTRDETGDRQLTDAEDFTKLELFNTGVLGGGHYGIRTGFASSEIDFMIIRSTMDQSVIQRVEWEIAKNGFYIPIVNAETGKLVFTPEEFDGLRSQLSGLPEYGSRVYDFSPSLDDLIVDQDVDEVTRNVKQTETTGQAVKSTIGTILSSSGVDVSDNPESHDAGAVLIDTGSTGRNTNIPVTGDFDIMVRLSPIIFNDTVKLSELKRILGEQLTGESGTLVVTGDGDFRIKGIRISGVVEPVDVDVSFVRQTTKLEYTSEQSIVERLSVIREQDEEKYYQVLANIAMAKRLLKSVHAYKKRNSPEAEGGLGGIGIENWVLHHGGSLLEAAQSFLEQARGKSLDQFREVYTVFDSGQNYYSNRRNGYYQYDNFVDNMTEAGFERMRDLCEQIVSGNIPT